MILNLRYIKVWLTASLLCIFSFCLLLSSKTLYAAELVYTIQTGSFSSEAKAKEQFKFIKHKLKREEADFLRIEKIGKFYAVRLGKFKDRINTERVIIDIEHLLDSALIMTAYIKENRIKKIYNVSLSGDNGKIEKESPAVVAAHKKRLASVNPDFVARDMLNPPPSLKRDIFSAGKWWQNPRLKSEKMGEGKLQLKATIIDDQGTIAIIDDEVLGVGESVKGLKITAIKNNEVLLSKGRQRYILRMNEE